MTHEETAHCTIHGGFYSGFARCPMCPALAPPGFTLLTDSELATILHGLRTLQCGGRIEGCAAGDCDHFDEAPALSDEEIDALAERLNLDGVAVRV